MKLHSFFECERVDLAVRAHVPLLGQVGLERTIVVAVDQVVVHEREGTRGEQSRVVRGNCSTTGSRPGPGLPGGGGAAFPEEGGRTWRHHPHACSQVRTGCWTLPRLTSVLACSPTSKRCICLRSCSWLGRASR